MIKGFIGAGAGLVVMLAFLWGLSEHTSNTVIAFLALSVGLWLGREHRTPRRPPPRGRNPLFPEL